MNNSPSSLSENKAFAARAAGLLAAFPSAKVEGGAPPLDEMFESFRRFTVVRRREASLALLAGAERGNAERSRAQRDNLPAAIAGFADGLARLTEVAARLRPLIGPDLDEVLVLAADPEHPLRALLHQSALTLGFNSEEAGWLFGELQAIDFRPLRLVGFAGLEVLVASVAAGETGLLHAGFPRFYGDPQQDEKLADLVIRLRGAGLTASLFLALAIVVTAHAVAAQGEPS